MARYNQWINTKVYDLCAGLDDADRRRPSGAFFGSIHGTLNHLLWGDRAWMNRLSDNTYDLPQPIGTVVCDDFANLATARRAMDADIIAWAEQLTDAVLAEPFTWVSGLDQRERTQPTWYLVNHMFNHQTHHRGQLTTLLSQRGLDYGSTDLPFMPGADDVAAL